MRPYVATRYRLANHVGGVRKRLAKALIQAFKHAGITILCEPKDFWPALGYWKHNCQDVMRWEGQISIWRHGKFSKRGIGSWDSMTDCLKGFTVWEDGFHIEVGAVDEKVAPSERYVCEFEAEPHDAYELVNSKSLSATTDASPKGDGK